ncbi:hypothetical protein [Acetobacter fabarum]|uniref:hypothetical protein n=1 Tax=Acetobacter fabarum TaxID=483199 RepID=UPI0020A0AD48|nr:hypothetical protein [Acetobacter fabarum]MCP1229435.1 hypothetical protein [Acetobacter fabarum]MCP1234953.1 hypothetical protein [Acetobacter fabarum]
MDLLIASNTVTLDQADKAPASGTPGWATDGDPATGQLATDAPAWHYNMMMSELIAIIKAAGITPSNADWSQVLKAMQTIFSPAQYGVAPYSAQLAQLVGGYPIGAVVFDADGNYWRSTQASNMSVPGADGAKWQSLFNGYATENWAKDQFLQLALATLQKVTGPVAFAGQTTVPDVEAFAGGDALNAKTAEGRYVKSVPAAGTTNKRITDIWENADGRTVMGDGVGSNVLASLSDVPTSGTFTGGYWIQTGNIRQIWWSQTVKAGDTVPYPLAFASAPRVFAQQNIHKSQEPYWEMGFVCIDNESVTAQNFVLNTTLLYSNTGGTFGPPIDGSSINFYAAGPVS